MILPWRSFRLWLHGQLSWSSSQRGVSHLHLPVPLFWTAQLCPWWTFRSLKENSPVYWRPGVCIGEVKLHMEGSGGEQLWHKAGARECITERGTWSKIPNFHFSSPCLHQTVSVGSCFFPFATKDGRCLSPLLVPEGAAWGTGGKRSKCLWTVPWCCSSRAVREPVL